jgi:PAS domain-containing protein
VLKKCKSLGYADLMEEEIVDRNIDSARKGIRMAVALPLLPPEMIEEGLREVEAMFERLGIATRMQPFIRYMWRQWIERVGVDVVSCFGQAVRINNHVEAFHRYLRSLFDTMNPGVWAFTREYFYVFVLGKRSAYMSIGRMSE